MNDTKNLAEPNTTPTSSIAATGKKILALLFAVSGIALLLWLDDRFSDYVDMPKLGRDVGYGMLILIGFLTSFHCVGMCGPLILGYTAKGAASGHASHAAHLLYGAGKTLSYTSLGALFGAFGSIIAFTPYTQGMVGMAAGVFLLLFGLHMLEIIPQLSHFQIKTPGFIMRFVGKEYRKHRNPFVIGLLNGLMIICGPLQAMYVMAAGTGSWSQGAAILFFFGVGTLPLLMGFGFLTGLLSANLTPKLLKASGVIVMGLGVIMLNRGLTVTGLGIDFNTLATRLEQQLATPVTDAPRIVGGVQTIEMAVLKTGFAPDRFTLQKGVPVKWIIDGKELNECNKGIVAPQLGLDIPLHPGRQVVEFTPPAAGVVPWSCWMGMMPGAFVVVEPPAAATPVQQPGCVDVLEMLKALWRWLQTFFQQLFNPLPAGKPD